VANRGYTPAGSTTVHLYPSSTLNVVGLSSPQGPCDVETRSCTVGQLDPGRQATVVLKVAGSVSGAQEIVATASSTRFDPDLDDNSGRTTVVVGTASDVTVDVSAQPGIGYVGGSLIVVTYTITNRGGNPARDVVLTTGLPAGLRPASLAASPANAKVRCQTPPAVCTLGTIEPATADGAVAVEGGAGTNVVQLRVALEPTTETNGAITAQVQSTDDADLDNNTASTSVQVLTPTLRITPVSGKPGLVPQVIGANFPPGARLWLRWNRGVNAYGRSPILVRQDGTFIAPMLVFHQDLLGVRSAVAVADPGTPAGTKFGQVSVNYLVVPGQDQPDPVAGDSGPDKWKYRR